MRRLTLILLLVMAGCSSAIQAVDETPVTQVAQEVPKGHVSLFDEPEIEAPKEVEQVLQLGGDGEAPLKVEALGEPVHKIKAYCFSIISCGACRTQEGYFQRWRTTNWKIGEGSENQIQQIKEGRNLDIWAKYNISKNTHTMPFWLVTVDGIPVKQFKGAIYNPDSIVGIWNQKTAGEMLAKSAPKGIANIDIPGVRKPYQSAVNVINGLLNGKYQINDKVTIISPKELNIKIKRVGDDILFEFLGERPRVSALGGWISPKLSAIRAKRDKAVAELAGFPDITIEFTE